MPPTTHIQTAVAEIQWQRFDTELSRIRDYIQNFRLGCPKQFEAAIRNSCNAEATKNPVTLNEAKRAHILKTVEQCGGNKKKAAKVLGCSNSTVHAHLKLDVNRHPTTCRPSLSTMLKSVGLSFVLLMSGTRSMAQGRAAATFSVQPEPTVISSISLPALAPTPKKTNALTWTHIPGVTYRVQVGASRGNYTNAFTVSTNQFPLTNGLAYAVWSVDGKHEAERAGLWPSNKVERVWVQTSTNLTQWNDAFIWQTNFNKPQEYLRLKSELIRWE